VSSDVPALLLTARFDALTPASWAADAASHLSSSTLVQLTRAAHLAIYTDASGCAASLLKGFLDAPSAPLSTACAN
jgi:pimeloyl-ACP methyl ester carboxylesterase